MPLLNNNLTSSVNNADSKAVKPSSQKVKRSIREKDFNEFIIEELEGPKKEIFLVGNQMPKDSLEFGGEQRILKDYYPGHSEPSVQVLGPKESNTTIKGEFKDNRYTDVNLYGAATELQQLVDSVRIRGNLCRFILGEWQRYGFIESTKFNMKNLAKVGYEIQLSVVGFNAPTNAKFLGQSREIPFDINEKLISQAQDFQSKFSTIPDEITLEPDPLSTSPDSIDLSIADQINELVSDVSSAVASVTGFVDSVLTTVQDIQKSIERAKGLIKYAHTKLESYKRTVGGFKAFDSSSSLSGQYANASYFSAGIASASSLSSLLVSFRTQFNNIVIDLPLGRHLVKTDDTLQKIAIKFYGSSDNWKKIYDYNNLTSTVLSTGDLLEVPRV